MLLGAAPLLAATSPSAHRTPAPRPSAHAPVPHVPMVHEPLVRLHTEFVVEVNRKGQVVRVKSARGCPNPTFNAQTYGNVLQMWIRHPNGTADAGLYRVTYDYDPRARRVTRRVALIRRGGTWANAQGAANDMLDTARREAESASGRNLPPLQNIIGSTPTPHPH
ncbi:MAG TPA: hypothetical protein VMV82_09540 [Candidatus Dormibacteraeota bacterium]|nr:hypothetical protein [Candidatus Dormibacteraeota bacterium]